MPLHSKEPPERPLAPTDLSHRNLICICHRPLIGHSFSPTSYLPPICPLVASIPVSYPQNGCAPRSPKTRPAACSADVKLSSWPTSPCPHSIDRYHVGTLPPALDRLVVLFRALSSSSLSLVSLYLTVPYATRPLSPNSTILQRAHDGRRTLFLYFRRLPFNQHTYPLVTLKTIQTPVAI